MSTAAHPSVPSARQRLASRVRILPLTILAVALLLGLKIGSLWQGRTELFVTPAGAQQPANQQAGQPTQLTPQSQPAAQAPAQAPQQMAQAPAAQAPAAQPQGAQSQVPRAGSSTVQSLAEKDPTTFTRAEIELLANLAQRRDQIEQRGREIDLRESLLAAAEKRLDDRINELKKLEASIKQIVQQYDKQEEQNLQGLVKVYENMKPKDAARIFEKLEPNILLGVVERMKEAKLATVLAEMSPATAQDLTVRLATRKQIPPSVRAGAESQLQPAVSVPVTPAGGGAQGQPPAARQPAAGAAPANAPRTGG